MPSRHWRWWTVVLDGTDSRCSGDIPVCAPFRAELLCLTSHCGALLQRQFLAETKTEVKQQLLDMGVFSLGKVFSSFTSMCT